MNKFIFTTTGTVSPVKFEELGAYFDHPTSAYTLTDSFTIEAIREATTIQTSLDNGEITAVDENGNSITNLSYADGNTPIFAVDDYDTGKSYIGYGTLTECKILQVITSTDSSYTRLWSGGNENFDKVWANRASYSYF